MQRIFLIATVLASLTNSAGAQPTDNVKNVLGPDAAERKLRQTALQSMRAEVNRKDFEAWSRIESKEAWEKHRDEKVALMRKSLGQFLDAPKQVKVLTTKKIEGDGFVIENLVYESRPGLVVTANLYVPSRPSGPMPGIVVIHSHHNPKTQGELQDMGMLWARAGCLVLVPDMLGHGERRQHPFSSAKRYPTSFKVSRQDYYFRYNVASQLHLIGDGLIGWMVWDLMRGIDVLLARPGIAKDKIVVLGSVAGGGDPCAVLGALDPRIAAVAPFNFGGPQPETKFPLPDNAELAFNYMGGGSWESTRNLRLSGRDGFLPWLIVAAAAPRGLIYAHEFAWDEKRDPAWKRVQKIYGFYNAGDRLSSVHGRGSVSGLAPESTHCNNIGSEHRKGIHPAFSKWFAIDAKEYAKRFPSDELQCLTVEAKERFQPRTVAELARDRADQMLAQERGLRSKLSREEQRARLRKQWSELLGVEMLRDGKSEKVAGGPWLNNHNFETLLIKHPKDAAVAVPVQLLVPKKSLEGAPVVVAFANDGKAGFLKHRAEVVNRLLSAGVAICLPDLRGTGELRTTSPGRGRTSADTSISATEWMHGRTVLGTQVQELLLVLDALRDQGLGSVALWGDSFAPVNAADAKVAVPYDAEGGQPAIGEPMGGLVALLGGLFTVDGQVKAIHIHGGLASYRSLLSDAFFWVPHDALVPGVLTICDIDDLAAALAPRPLSIESPIDAHNQQVPSQEFATVFALTRAAYPPQTLALRDSPGTAAAIADWFAAALLRK